MKKYLLLVIIFSFVLFWCQKKDVSKMDVSTISDLATLQGVVSQVSHEIQDWVLSLEQGQTLVAQLQQKYLDFVDVSDKNIENVFDGIQKNFDEKWLGTYWLPLWARKLWMTQPKGMELNTGLSTYTIVNDSGYSSTTLVYNWNYTIALQQAQNIAKWARLSVSKNFQQAQAIAKLGNIDYISGLDVGGLTRWIVYVNHELLDTNIDNLLSVSVEQDWTLTIEVTKYIN
jgi:hypothetical protein